MSEDEEIASWLREQAEYDGWRAGRAGVFVSDPRTEAARAEAILAVLGDYAATLAVKDGVEAKLAAGRNPEPNDSYLEALRELAVYRLVARRLAYGYRSREGYKLEWAP